MSDYTGGLTDPTAGMSGSEAAAYHEEMGEGVSEDDTETQLDPEVEDPPEMAAGPILLPPDSP